MIKIIECNTQNIIFYKEVSINFCVMTTICYSLFSRFALYTVHFFSNKQILYFLTITNLKIIDDSIINVKC